MLGVTRVRPAGRAASSSWEGLDDRKIFSDKIKKYINRHNFARSNRFWQIFLVELTSKCTIRKLCFLHKDFLKVPLRLWSAKPLASPLYWYKFKRDRQRFNPFSNWEVRDRLIPVGLGVNEKLSFRVFYRYYSQLKSIKI